MNVVVYLLQVVLNFPKTLSVQAIIIFLCIYYIGTGYKMKHFQ